MRAGVLASVLCSAGLSITWGADDPKPVTPEEAAKKVGESVLLQMEVKSATLRDDTCFLNSEKDFKDARNFTVFIGREALAKFRAAKIDDPAAHFKGKTVQVQGKVKLYKERPEIALGGPDEIKIVEKKSR